MDTEKETYFKDVKETLEVNLMRNKGKRHKLKADVPLMPLQYKYIHNLKTGEFEETEGVDKILGYPNQQFTLEFYYSILHQHDLEIVFEMTRKGTEWANVNGYIMPGQLQISLFHRVKRITGEYAYIFRQSMLYETKGADIIRTISICTDVTELGIKAIKPAHLYVPGINSFSYKGIWGKKGEKEFQKLTHREKEIAILAMDGHTSGIIGEKLNISKHTLDTHRRRILKKTGLSSTFELRDALLNSSLS